MNTNIKNRLAIYFFYDADGVVDDYIPYFLDDLQKNITELLVVCNGKLTEDGKNKFLQYTSNVIVRENTGFDVWAYKTAMDFYGWKRLREFEEVILLNFTLMGPIYPFSDMFDKMDSLEDLDFWGITKHHGETFDWTGLVSLGYIPEHVQSSFMCFRKKFINSTPFQNYWNNIPQINSMQESVAYHEALFTKRFSEMGFNYDVYIHTEDLKDKASYPLMLYPMELIRNRKCNVFKRKNFYNIYEEIIRYSTGEPTYELYEYIKNETNYPTQLIWDNILRSVNMADLKNRMQLNYVLSSKEQMKRTESVKTIALIMHLFYEDLVDYCFCYATSMPTDCDVYITVVTQQMKSKVEQRFKELNCNRIEVRLIENRGRDVSALLVGCKDIVMQYDYVCFAHDKKSSQVNPLCVGESFSYKCFENILKNNIFVENIIQTFQENPKLGMLFSAPPNHGDYYHTLGLEWTGNFDKAKKLAQEIGITVDMDPNKTPISPLGTMFWFRPAALKILFDHGFTYSDFPQEPNGIDDTILHSIERLYGFACQQELYYPAYVYCDSLAAMEITNLTFMLRDMNMALFRKFGCTDREKLLWLIYNLDTGGNNENLLTLTRMDYLKGFLRKTLPPPVWQFVKKVYRLIRKQV